MEASDFYGQRSYFDAGTKHFDEKQLCDKHG